MKVKQVKRTIKGLIEEASSKYPMMNYGGCAGFAGLVAKELTLLGLECDVVTPTTGVSPAEVRKKLRKGATIHDWDLHGLDRGHFATRFKIKGKSYTFDSECFEKTTDTFSNCNVHCPYPMGEGLTYKESLKLYKQPSWNDTFDRSEFPAIKAMVKRHMKPLRKMAVNI